MTAVPASSREATQKDYPRTGSKETQCPLCWRMFTSDSACELHKPYRKPVGPACKDPEAIGMEFIERRGIRFWRVPMTPEQMERFRGRAAEHSAPECPSVV